MPSIVGEWERARFKKQMLILNDSLVRSNKAYRALKDMGGGGEELHSVPKLVETRTSLSFLR